MILEHAQMMCTVHHEVIGGYDYKIPYKSTVVVQRHAINGCVIIIEKSLSAKDCDCINIVTSGLNVRISTYYSERNNF